MPTPAIEMLAVLVNTIDPETVPKLLLYFPAGITFGGKYVPLAGTCVEPRSTRAASWQ